MLFTTFNPKSAKTSAAEGGGSGRRQIQEAPEAVQEALKKAMKIYQKCASTFYPILTPNAGPRPPPGASFEPPKPPLEAPQKQT